MNSRTYQFLYPELTRLRHEYLSGQGITLDGQDFGYILVLEGRHFIRLQDFLRTGANTRSILGVDRFFSSSVKSIFLRFYFMDGSTWEYFETDLNAHLVEVPTDLRRRKIKAVRYFLDHDPLVFQHPSLHEEKHIEVLRRNIRDYLLIHPHLPVEVLGLRRGEDPLTWTPPEDIPLDFWSPFISKIWSSSEGVSREHFLKAFEYYQEEKLNTLENLKQFQEILLTSGELYWSREREYLHGQETYGPKRKTLGLRDLFNRYRAYFAYKKSLAQKDPVLFWDAVRRS